MTKQEYVKKILTKNVTTLLKTSVTQKNVEQPGGKTHNKYRGIKIKK